MKIETIMKAIRSELLAREAGHECGGCEFCKAFDELTESPIAHQICRGMVFQLLMQDPEVVFLNAIAIGIEIGLKKAAAEQLEQLEARS